MYGETWIASVLELHKDELSRGYIREQNLTRYSNRYIHTIRGCNDECRLASSEYEINGEKRNLEVLITGI